MLVLETSPGTEHATGLMHPRAFRDGDLTGVIGFHRTVHLMQPLTADRDALAAALQRASIRVGVSVRGVQVNPNLTVDLAGALKQACGEFGERGPAGRKRVIVVLFGSEDPNLSAQLETIGAMLGAADARLYAVMVQRVAGGETRGSPRTWPVPTMTAQLMSRLAEESGGRIFKRNWDLKEILSAARKP